MNDALPDKPIRCPWPGDDPLYVAYHDHEWATAVTIVEASR